MTCRTCSSRRRPSERSARSTRALNGHLADAFDLQSQVKQAHWNVKGSDLWQLHKLFDEVAARAAEWVDELAECITALGGYANGMSYVCLIFWAAASRSRIASRV